MTPNCRTGENGLSEVVGFVLILGVLVLVFSLYLTYGIPAQGRENEILHMNDVKDQFVAYKLSMDSLFTNNKVGTTLGNSFSLGTSGGYTQGMMSFIPIMSPVSSGGVIAINQRTPDPEYLNISSHSLVMNDTFTTSEELQEGVPLAVTYTPDHLYINISGIQPVNLGPAGTFSVNVSGKNWITYINITPRMTYYQNYTLIPPASSGALYTLSLLDAYDYDRSDIAITVKKGSMTTIQDFTVYRNVSSNTVYPVDLMDETYGLNTLVTSRDIITLVTEKTSGAIVATGNATYEFVDMNPYTITPVSLGSIEYRARNNYWIPQTYYYQMGGVFLSQNDGNVSYKLPPEISFTNDSANDLVLVNINALNFKLNPDNPGLIGGNSPVQVKTRLDSIYPLPYAPGDEITGNTKKVRIGITTTDTRANAMWENYFESEARTKGILGYKVDREQDQSYIEINGPYEDDTRNDIRLTVTNATYSTWVHGVGGVYE